MKQGSWLVARALFLFSVQIKRASAQEMIFSQDFKGILSFKGTLTCLTFNFYEILFLIFGFVLSNVFHVCLTIY